MAWIIDEFKVKPSGFLASTRGVRVWIDENGNLSVTEIPGVPFANQPCISDYNKEYRYWNNGDTITTFCNLTTFTEYVVKAQNCTPFAVVTTNLNAPQCGYLTPLPTPAVPPNPFGVPDYGPYRELNFCDVDGNEVNVLIEKKSYNGPVGEIEFGGGSPVILSRRGSDNKFHEVIATECKLTFICSENFSLQQLYTTDEREYRVTVTKFGVTKFQGYIIPDSCQEPFMPKPYEVTIRATDGLGGLKNITYPVPAGSSINIRQRFIDILCYVFSQTGLELNIRSIVNLYEMKMLTGIDDDPLAQSQVNPLRLADDKGQIEDCYKVLEDLCKVWKCSVVQQNGEWVFFRRREQNGNILRTRIYNHTGFFLRSEQIDTNRSAGSVDNTDVKMINSDQFITIGNAYKRADVILKYGKVPSIVFNGDFELWDGNNFNYWTRYGGVNVSQVQKYTFGEFFTKIPLQEYYCKFNEVANSGKWLQANEIGVLAGDKITLTIQANMFGLQRFKFRVKIGDKYLYNDVTNLRAGEVRDYQWVDSLASASFDAHGTDATNLGPQVAFNTYSITFPDAPMTGVMSLQLFGFVNLDYEAYSMTVTENLTTNPEAGIDKFQISKVSKADDKLPDGTLYRSQQLKFYTNAPEQEEIKYGDSQTQDFTIYSNGFNVTFDYFMGSLFIPGGTSGGTTVSPAESKVLLTQLYAIYTADGGYSSNWKEFGTGSESLQIGAWAAKSVLQQYQAPFRYFSGTFLGTDLEYLDLYSMDTPCFPSFSDFLFAILSADFDLKTNQMTSVTMAQMFQKSIKTDDSQGPHNPGDLPPPIIQNPNYPSPDTIEGIFTEQFTEQFL